MTWFLVDINTHWGQLNLNLKRRSAILLQVSRFCNILKFEHTLQNFRSSELYLQFDVLWCTEWCCGRSWWTCRIMWRSLDGKYCDVYWPSHFIGMRNFGNQSRRNLTLCVPCIICDVLMTNEIHSRAVDSSWTRLHDCTDFTKPCNTVYYAVLLMMND